MSPLLPRYDPEREEADAKRAVEKAEREGTASADAGPAAAGGDPVQLRGIPIVPVRRLGERPSSSPPTPWRTAKVCPTCGRPKRNARNRCRCPKPKGITRMSTAAPPRVEEQPESDSLRNFAQGVFARPAPLVLSLGHRVSGEVVRGVDLAQSSARHLSFEERQGLHRQFDKANRERLERLKQERGRCSGCATPVDEPDDDCPTCRERLRARRRQAAQVEARDGQVFSTGRRLTEADRQRALALAERGAELREIAAELGCSESTISRLLARKRQAEAEEVGGPSPRPGRR